MILKKLLKRIRLGTENKDGNKLITDKKVLNKQI